MLQSVIESEHDNYITLPCFIAPICLLMIFGDKRSNTIQQMINYRKQTFRVHHAERLKWKCSDLLIEKEPIVNTYISMPKDKSNLNCAAFVAGIVEAMLTVIFNPILSFDFPCTVAISEALILIH